MIKQVILMRRDLNMRRGKEIAQGSHASQAWLISKLEPAKLDCDAYLHTDEIWWLKNGTKKVTLQVFSENQLVELYNKAKELGLTAHMIID
jgi:PTH2 family peptidyl-tRNA hydrolase